jgi:cyanophycinase
MAARASGPLALVGGAEFTSGCEDFDRELIAKSGATEVLVLAAAAAFIGADAVVDKAHGYFSTLGIAAVGLPVLHRRDGNDADMLKRVHAAKFVYLSDGSPLHLRSILKDSPLWEAIQAAHAAGGALAASGAGATLIGDPMVDPRGGAYTVGLGLVPNLAIFPYHGDTADHLRRRSIDLLPRGARLAGVDARTALVSDGDGWRVMGAGTVSLYAGGEPTKLLAAGDTFT